MNKENKIYTAADFAKYYNGNMPFAEMHALEKAALDDPFLADALEGYDVTQTAENDVALVKKQVNDFTSKSKVFSLPSFLNAGWLRIAAILVVMLGVGYFFYDKYDNGKISIVKNDVPVKDTLQIAEAETTTNTDTTSLATATEKPTTTPSEKTISLADNTINNNDKSITSTAAAPAIIENRADETDDEKKNFVANNTQQNNTQNYSNYYTQQGNVTDKRGGPMQGVTVKDKNSNNGTVTDNNGKFTLKTTDSNAYVSVASVGFKSKEVLLNNNSSQKITLDKQTANLEEVVVTGYATKRRKAEIGVATTKVNPQELNGKVSGLNVQPVNASPSKIKGRKSNTVIAKADTTVNNLAAFNDYVKNNIIPLFNENNNPARGKVSLSFDTDKNGRPQNITVINSTCPACNDQAINLLKNGPGWPPNILQQSTVIISF